MSDHVSERGATCGATKMCCAVHGCVNKHEAGFFFFFSKRKLRHSGYQWLLMNTCCNLNTELRASESPRSHSKKISTFFHNDGVNLG